MVDLATLKQLAGEDSLNMTRLALKLSEYANGVAKSHGEVSRKMYPGYRVHVVTNGVHPYTWTPEQAKALLTFITSIFPGWCHESELLVRAECCISDEAIWATHVQAKSRMIETIKELSGITFDPELPILGFARRMTAYKRPDLLVTDLDRLKNIAKKAHFQIILAGKAHPKDQEGKRLIETLHGYIAALGNIVPLAYLPNYDMQIALAMVSGVDVWLNTPLRPLEASGTSGMKAAFMAYQALAF